MDENNQNNPIQQPVQQPVQQPIQQPVQPVQEPQPNYANVQSQAAQPVKKSNTGLIVVIIVMAIVIIGLIIAIVMISSSKKKPTVKDLNMVNLMFEDPEDLEDDLEDMANDIIFEDPEDLDDTTSSNTINEVVGDKKASLIIPVEDVIEISGRGTMAVGKIEQGTVKTGDIVEIVGVGKEIIKSKVIAMEMFRKVVDKVEAGENAGYLLEGVSRNDIERGCVIVAPKTMTGHTKFEASIDVLSKDEGGRHTPFFNNYRPQFYFRTTDVTGVLTLSEGVESIMPGDKNQKVTIELVNSIGMKEGDTFQVREGGRTIATGKITKIIE